MPASITLTVSHLPTSTAFFLSALQPLNYGFRARAPDDSAVGFGPTSPPNTPIDFWIAQEIPGVPAGAAHVAFPALNRAQVEAFFAAALKAGGSVHGTPAQRDGYGYYSAAVIDFDGNSIEAVYRPELSENKENGDVQSTVKSRPGTVVSTATKSKAGTVVSTAAKSKAGTVVSTIPRSEVSVKPGSSVSQARSIAPSQANTAAQSTASQAPAEKPKQGDMLDTLLNEARSAADVARNLVASVRSANTTTASTPQSQSKVIPTSGGGGAGEAIVGTLLGVAAGAALHYAFSNRSSSSDKKDNEGDERRPSIAGRSYTEPPNVPQYHYTTSTSYVEHPHYRRAIEAPPSTYSRASGNGGGQRLITMHDNDPSPSDYQSTIRPAARSRSRSVATYERRASIDSGFGASPDNSPRSVASKPPKKDRAPPTSYRAPTALTTVDTKVDGSRARSRSRASSTSRTSSSTRNSEHRSRSQSRSHTSRRSRRDSFEAEARDSSPPRTVLHVTERPENITSYPPSTMSKTASKHEGQSKVNSTSRASSRTRSNVIAEIKGETPSIVERTRRPSEISLLPSRAATWAGSEGGDRASFVSARSRREVEGPQTVIGKLTARNLQGAGSQAATRSVIGKVREVAKLDVTNREVGPEDSVSQVSSTRGSRRGHH